MDQGILSFALLSLKLSWRVYLMPRPGCSPRLLPGAFQDVYQAVESHYPGAAARLAARVVSAGFVLFSSVKFLAPTAPRCLDHRTRRALTIGHLAHVAHRMNTFFSVGVRGRAVRITSTLPGAEIVAHEDPFKVLLPSTSVHDSPGSVSRWALAWLVIVR